MAAVRPASSRPATGKTPLLSARRSLNVGRKIDSSAEGAAPISMRRIIAAISAGRHEKSVGDWRQWMAGMASRSEQANCSAPGFGLRKCRCPAGSSFVRELSRAVGGGDHRHKARALHPRALGWIVAAAALSRIGEHMANGRMVRSQHSRNRMHLKRQGMAGFPPAVRCFKCARSMSLSAEYPRRAKPCRTPAGQATQGFEPAPMLAWFHLAGIT